MIAIPFSCPPSSLHPSLPSSCLQHPSIQVNVEVRKESDLYGDMVVLPFIDRYDLVVLKTIAICEFGVRAEGGRGQGGGGAGGRGEGRRERV